MDVSQPDLDRVAENFLSMVGKLGLDATADAVVADDRIQLNVKTPEPGRLIGRRGKTLAAIQLLLNGMVRRDHEEFPRVYIDVDGYRANGKGRTEPVDADGEDSTDDAADSRNDADSDEDGEDRPRRRRRRRRGGRRRRGNRDEQAEASEAGDADDAQDSAAAPAAETAQTAAADAPAEAPAAAEVSEIDATAPAAPDVTAPARPETESSAPPAEARERDDRGDRGDRRRDRGERSERGERRDDRRGGRRERDFRGGRNDRGDRGRTRGGDRERRSRGPAIQQDSGPPPAPLSEDERLRKLAHDAAKEVHMWGEPKLLPPLDDDKCEIILDELKDHPKVVARKGPIATAGRIRIRVTERGHE